MNLLAPIFTDKLMAYTLVVDLVGSFHAFQVHSSGKYDTTNKD
eukprot:CAMPEP_0194736550 /NCGR_PEP_ID=MMETSP0296-20130528/77727_1 /TAXON_ID=39354 /ORGANISM="Heterosigma akashiwo, Strain CCMP2393" /LENGTH=42 /DNA_ID= /DNA_START= /DNA_END= /DNA_ORIENTATION=